MNFSIISLKNTLAFMPKQNILQKFGLFTLGTMFLYQNCDFDKQWLDYHNLAFKQHTSISKKLVDSNEILYSGDFVNKKPKEHVPYDSDSSSDEEEFHKPEFDSDGEKEFVEDDSGYLVNTDSEDEGHSDVSDKSDSES